MDRYKIAAPYVAAIDPRNGYAGATRLAQEKIGGVDPFAVHRQRRQELHRQSECSDRSAKLLAIRPVPGNNRIERSKVFHKSVRRVHIREAHQIDAGGGDRPHTIRKSNQRDSV